MRPFAAAAGAGVLLAVVIAAFAMPGSTASAPPVAQAAGCTPMPSGSHRLASIDGRIPVVLHVGRSAMTGAPLILALPGAGQTARDFAAYTGYSALADREGFSVAYPTATGSRPSWNISGVQDGKPDDVAYLRRVIPQVVRAACADPARVGVTGVSNGGGMTARLACDAAELIAAAAPVAGGYRSLPDCHPVRPVPILEIHGTADPVVPYRGTGPDAAGSVSTFLARWRDLDGCAGGPWGSKPEPDVVALRWTRCAAGTVVQHDRILGGGHEWPGGDDVDGTDRFAATRRTWDFLSAPRHAVR